MNSNQLRCKHPEPHLRSVEQRLDHFVVFNRHVEGLQELRHKGVHNFLRGLVLLVDDLEQTAFFHCPYGVKKTKQNKTQTWLSSLWILRAQSKTFFLICFLTVESGTVEARGPFTAFFRDLLL